MSGEFGLDERSKDATEEMTRRQQADLPEMASMTTRGELDDWLERWGDRLWVFWSWAIQRLDVVAANLPSEFGAETEEKAQAMATRLIEALRSRDVPPREPWKLTNIAAWLWWLHGTAAVRRRQGAKRGAELGLGAGPVHSDEAVQHARDAVNTVIVELNEAVDRVVGATGRPVIRWDWLWATCKARRAIVDYLIETGAGSVEWKEAKKDLVAKTSAGGKESKERTRRSRAGAAAAFRVNAAYLEARVDKRPPGTLVGVFLGPTEDETPYRPRRAVTEDGYRYFVSVLCASKSSRALKAVQAVLDCALNKAVARLLPKKFEKRLGQEWSTLMEGER